MIHLPPNVVNQLPAQPMIPFFMAIFCLRGRIDLVMKYEAELRKPAPDAELMRFLDVETAKWGAIPGRWGNGI